MPTRGVPRSSIQVLAAGLLATGLLPAGLAASVQGTRGLTQPAPAAHVAEGDRHHEALRPAAALESYTEALRIRPHHYPALWRAAREAVSLGMLAGSDQAGAERYEQAEGFARRATEADPEGVEGHHWLSVALGRMALGEGPRTRIRMGEEVRRIALRVLELDPDHAGAHHVLGHWHAEVKRLGGVSRFLADHVLGAGEQLAGASWEEARAHLERAVELAPENLIHRLELARVYLDSGMDDQARRELRAVLERPALEPTDPLHKQKAQELLRTTG